MAPGRGARLSIIIGLPLINCRLRDVGGERRRRRPSGRRLLIGRQGARAAAASSPARARYRTALATPKRSIGFDARAMPTPLSDVALDATVCERMRARRTSRHSPKQRPPANSAPTAIKSLARAGSDKIKRPNGPLPPLHFRPPTQMVSYLACGARSALWLAGGATGERRQLPRADARLWPLLLQDDDDDDSAHLSAFTLRREPRPSRSRRRARARN